MRVLPCLADFGLTRDEVTAQSFGFTKNELYEGALECIRKRAADLIDAELAACVDEYEIIFGDFAWDQDFVEIFAAHFPDLAQGALNEAAFCQEIAEPGRRATVAYELAGPMIDGYRVGLGEQGRFLAACGVVAADWEGAGQSPAPAPEPSFAPAPHLASNEAAAVAPPPPPPPALSAPPPPPPSIKPPGESPPAPPPPPYSSEPLSPEMLGVSLTKLSNLLFLDKALFAKGLGVSEGSVNNYATGRTVPKKFTSDQKQFLIAEIDGRIALLRQLAAALG